MTKKSINMVLIVFLLVIWGSIGYTYFVKKEVTQNTVITTANNIPTTYTIRKDTFELQEIKNPFKTALVIPKRKTPKTNTNTVRKAQQKQLQKSVQWPNLQYHGYVMSKGSSKKLGVIKVNGKIIKKREQDMILETFKIKRIYEDSIQITYNKTSKIIKKH
jgi:hypothetical protein